VNNSKNKTNRTNKSVKIIFQDENITSFAGVSLAERLANRLRLWSDFKNALPARAGYSWSTIIKSVSMGLLTGSQGTFAAEELRGDRALRAILGLNNVQEEATTWRALEDLGSSMMREILSDELIKLNRKIFERSNPGDLMLEGFYPVFGDGTGLEGSRRREASKKNSSGEWGLLWSTIFIGPLLFAEKICEAGEGEETAVRKLFSNVYEKFIKTSPHRDKFLVMLDSLYGDNVALSEIEDKNAKYVVGANKLAIMHETLESQPEIAWVELGGNKKENIEKSAVCICSIQCKNWTKKRILIGYREMKCGTFFYEYRGVITNLEAEDVKHVPGKTFMQKVLHLYRLKAGMENHYKSLLSDLGLHYPPCREYSRNAGFYALGAIAYTLARGVDLIGSAKSDGDEKSFFMRLWRIRRKFFTVAGKVISHGREMILTFFISDQEFQEEFRRYWDNIACC
jgi:hypothetical protein